MDNQEIELRENTASDLHHHDHDHDHDQEEDNDTNRLTSIEFSLPPADRGKDAWLVLAGGFIMEGLVWGFPFSYGIFQEHYSSLDLFKGGHQESQIPVIGTVASGLMYLGSPLSLTLCRRFPHRRRQIMVAGMLILCASLVGASFARNVWQLILTQGVLFAVGGNMLYYPVFLLIDEWFVQRKGLAFGICWAATGLSGLVIPFLMSWMLKAYQFRTTLRIWAVVNLVLTLPALSFLKPRLPPSMVVRVHRPRLGFAAKPFFLAFQIGNIMQGLGYFLPAIYLPSYAISLGFSGATATASVSLINVGAFLGNLTVGLLVDRWSIMNVIFMVTAGATLAVVLIWGFASSAVVVVVFALLYGFFAGSFSTTWPGVVREVVSKDTTQTVEAAAVFCLLVVGRGIGSVVSGPLSQGLLTVPRLTKEFPYGYGSDYGLLIVFAASTALCGGLGPICKRCGII